MITTSRYSGAFPEMHSASLLDNTNSRGEWCVTTNAYSANPEDRQVYLREAPGHLYASTATTTRL